MAVSIGGESRASRRKRSKRGVSAQRDLGQRHAGQGQLLRRRDDGRRAGQDLFDRRWLVQRVSKRTIRLSGRFS